MKNKNSDAIIILCSQLCKGENIKPFTDSEWSRFASNIMDKGLTPSDIVNMNLDELKLHFNDVEARRIYNLIGRSGSIVFELMKLKERGINIVTRADQDYPSFLKEKMGKKCPPLLYYIGDLKLCGNKTIGIVGSRSIGAPEENFTKKLVEKLVTHGYSIVSGGAKGVDSLSTNTAIALGGSAIEFVSDSMLTKIKKKEVIDALMNGRLLIISFAKPDLRFTVAMAMARNKYIYMQSEGTVVIKSDYNKGGTWSGATEALKKGYCPVFCRKDEKCSGNNELIRLGAIPIDEKWDCNLITSQSEELLEGNQPMGQINLFKGL